MLGESTVNDPQSLVENLKMQNLLEDINTFVVSGRSNQLKPLYFCDAGIFDSKAVESGLEDFSTHCGSGESFDRSQAEIAAAAEALEGYCSDNLTNPKEIICTASRLKYRHISPEIIGLFNEDQYLDLDFDRYHPNSAIGWVPGQSLTHDELTYVPALSTYLNYSPGRDEQVLFQPGSSGLATGSSLEQATLSGLYEVIERDAFMITWLNQLPARRVIIPASMDIHPHVKMLEQDGFEVKLFSLLTDSNCYVVLGVLTKSSDSTVSAFVGLGADINLCSATEKCVLEAMRSVITHSQELGDPQVQARIEQFREHDIPVIDMEDHGYFYQKRDVINQFDFLDDGSEMEIELPADARSQSNEHKIEQLVGSLNDSGLEVICIDLTTSDIKELGARVVRVIVPGLMPIHHGEGQRRLGNPRLYTFPEKCGLSDLKKPPWELNPNPHPLG